MKNKEKFAKEILDIALEHDVVAVTRKERIVMGCSQMKYCENCLFYRSPGSSCKREFKKWANSEYKEKKEFSEADKAYVRAMDKLSWFARDKNGQIYGYVDKPFKDVCLWAVKAEGDGEYEIEQISNYTSATFEPLSWEDEEPTHRSEILGRIE